MALSQFQIAYQRALTGREPDPMPVIEPDEVLEPLTAEEANQHTRELEDRYFQIYEPDRNQRRVLYDAAYGKFGRTTRRDCSL